MNIEHWIAIGAAAISLCGFLLSAWQAWQAKKERKAAEEAAERAITAAEDSAASQKRIADAIEEMNTRYSPSWEVRHYKGDTYILVNNSDEDALDVTVETKSPVIQGEKYHQEKMTPSSTLQFWHASSWGGSDEMTVTWRRPSETWRRTWDGHVPPK